MTGFVISYEDLETEKQWTHEITDGPWQDGEEFTNYMSDMDLIEEFTELILQVNEEFEDSVDFIHGPASLTITSDSSVKAQEWKEIARGIKRLLKDHGATMSKLEEIL